MSIPKLMGIENEYGLFMPKAGNDDSRHPDMAAQLIVNSAKAITPAFAREKENKEPEALLNDFPDKEVQKILAEIRDEKTTGADMRREVLRTLGASGTMLSNGARFYVDLGHPEYSTPECLSAKQLVIADKAGERIVELAKDKVEKEIGVEMIIHKDNSDRQGMSFGTHENYLVKPETFKLITGRSKEASQLVNFLIARQLLCGGGKVGSEYDGHPADYQISQRADFVEAIWHNDTGCRSIINTRDRPYADPSKFSRLHIILGDANFCEYASFLKVGLTAIFLKMMEDDFISTSNSFLNDPVQNPIVCLKIVSRDLGLKEPLPMTSGKKATAINILEEAVRLSYLYFDSVGGPIAEEENDVLKTALFFIEKLKIDFYDLFGYSDWVTKYVFVRKAQERAGLSWNSDHLKRVEQRYNLLDKEHGAYFALDKAGKIKHLVGEADILQAIPQPPENTRAYFRGKCVEKFGWVIDNIAWDFVKFRVPLPDIWRGIPLRVDLPDPLAGKEVHQHILDELSSFLGSFNRLSDLENVSFGESFSRPRYS